MIRHVPIFLTLMIAIGGWVYTYATRNNDIKHLKIDVCKMDKKLDKLAERVAHIEGKLDTE